MQDEKKYAEPEMKAEEKILQEEMSVEEMKTYIAELEKINEELMENLEEVLKMTGEEDVKMQEEKPVEEMKVEQPEVEKPKVEIEIESMEQTKKELSEVKAKLELAEKTNKFQVMLSEGKAVEAQREAFLSGNMIEFAEKSVAIKLSEQGHGGTPKVSTLTTEEEVLKQAKTLSESEKIGMKEAISKVLNSNKQLAEKIR